MLRLLCVLITTASIALHAMLGCWMHRAEVGHWHGATAPTLSQQVSHFENLRLAESTHADEHHETHKSPTDEAEHEGDCDFTFSKRTADPNLMFAHAVSLETGFDLVSGDAVGSALLSKMPDRANIRSQYAFFLNDAQAVSQVWRL